MISTNNRTSYCYARVSSETQGSGYGMSRQADSLLDYVKNYEDKEKLGFLLNCDQIVWLRAEGVSAFKGKNLADGSVLKSFITGVITGEIINACLLIENVDRFSRQNPIEAAQLFLSLINADCPIIEVENDIVHHKHSDLTLITAGLIRANKESARKQKLSQKNWDKRFDQALKKNDIVSGNHPNWLTIIDNKYEIVETDAMTYRKIFELFLNNYGPSLIRDYLVEQNLQANGRLLRSNEISRILRDRRLTGQYRSAKVNSRKVLDGQSIFPVIVQPADFNAVQNMLNTSVYSTHKQKIGKSSNNLFSTIALCEKCGSALTVNYASKNKSLYYYRCSASILRNKTPCDALGMRYDYIEKAIIQNIRHVDFSVNKRNDNNVQKRLNLLLKDLQHKTAYRDELLEDINALEIPDPSDRRILKNVIKKIAEIETEINNVRSIDTDTTNVDSVRSIISDEIFNRDNQELRIDLNSRLCKVLKRVEIERLSGVDIIIVNLNYFISDNTQFIFIDASNGRVTLQGYKDNKTKISYFEKDGKHMVLDYENMIYTNENGELINPLEW
ncbi:recombinase zinc beta ribbon domain-containing protein [Yersinia intermedia]|uniref:recombinase zinc beta ribbon domain-containing protein n=1 Tax=Yersinia intermedia TaxID=631 RepID=UPI00065D57E6|nr:recombinase zinc beta ribbon domain-containing protein [Yersinia intermedia]CRY75367.1 Recombinase [Yersinia intermedia]